MFYSNKQLFTCSKCLKGIAFKPLGHRFRSFRPYDQLFKLLQIIDGTYVTISSQGNVFWLKKSSLKLFCMFQNFLLPISKITKKLNFSSSKCVFQELHMGKMIGHARQNDGLYLLEAERRTTCSSPLPIYLKVLHPIKLKFSHFIFIQAIHHSDYYIKYFLVHLKDQIFRFPL